MDANKLKHFDERLELLQHQHLDEEGGHLVPCRADHQEDSSEVCRH